MRASDAGAASRVDACEDSRMIAADTVRDWAALDRLERSAGQRGGGSGVAGDYPLAGYGWCACFRFGVVRWRAEPRRRRLIFA